jgi:hypothetical protein
MKAALSAGLMPAFRIDPAWEPASAKGAARHVRSRDHDVWVIPAPSVLLRIRCGSVVSEAGMSEDAYGLAEQP